MIGKKILDFRRKKGLSLSELAERATISKSYLSNIERNLHRNPSILVMKKIAAVLDVDLRVLILPDIEMDAQEPINNDMIDFIHELQQSGIEKEHIHEYKTLIEFIKWQNQNFKQKKT